MADDVLGELTRAADGLLYPSDTDAPFEVHAWPAGPADAQAALLANAPPPPGAKIQEVLPEEFFGELTDDPRFQTLRHTLQTSLTGLHILRVGQVNIAIYLLGQLPDGRWAAIKTVSVES